MPASDYIVTIGLEVHCQVKTQSKMFCACPTSFGAEPNSNTCPTCLGLPGALPVLNAWAIEQTILTGQLIGCSTPPVSRWDRKSYFYPDMPKNFQTTQMDLPLCLGGEVPLYDYAYPKDAQKKIANPGKKVQLNRIHLEEDVAKSTHLGGASLVDFNRAGTPLMEIVTEPDLTSADEAFAYLKSLQQILVYGGVSDADMEKGQMRCDVNISLRKNENDPLGDKVELKNLNSSGAVRRAINYEIVRQAQELDAGIAQIQSTRRWDDDMGETQLMRTKEDAHDYRYFACPDLLPIPTDDLVKAASARRPELPHEKVERLQERDGITAYDASVLCSSITLADYYESATSATSAPQKKVANWIINILLGKLNDTSTEIEHCPISAAQTAQTVELIEAGTVSNNQAREVYDALWQSPDSTPADIAKKLGFEPADSSELDGIIDEVIAANPEKVAEIQGGNPKLANWLTGQVMKASKGKANPKIVTAAIQQKLGI